MIRRLTTDDAAAYRALRLHALETDPHAFGSLHEIEATWPLDRFRDRLATSHIYAEFHEGAPIAIAAFRQQAGRRESHKAHIWGVYVSPSHRGQGVATRLLRTLTAAARPLVEQLTLTAVHDNPAALALYERLGFFQYGLEPRALKAGDTYQDEALLILLLATKG